VFCLLVLIIGKVPQRLLFLWADVCVCVCVCVFSFVSLLGLCVLFLHLLVSCFARSCDCFACLCWLSGGCRRGFCFCLLFLYGCLLVGLYVSCFSDLPVAFWFVFCLIVMIIRRVPRRLQLLLAVIFALYTCLSVCICLCLLVCWVARVIFVFSVLIVFWLSGGRRCFARTGGGAALGGLVRRLLGAGYAFMYLCICMYIFVYTHAYLFVDVVRIHINIVYLYMLKVYVYAFNVMLGCFLLTYVLIDVYVFDYARVFVCVCVSVIAIRILIETPSHTLHFNGLLFACCTCIISTALNQDK